VKFVYGEEMDLGEEGDTVFMVSRAVMRSASRSGERG
jgi:hypothetical protein